MSTVVKTIVDMGPCGAHDVGMMKREYDNEGRWTGICARCGTDHDGFEPGTLGGEMRCLRSQAGALGAEHLVDQIDAGQREADRRRDEVLVDHGVGMTTTEADLQELRDEIVEAAAGWAGAYRGFLQDPSTRGCHLLEEQQQQRLLDAVARYTAE